MCDGCTAVRTPEIFGPCQLNKLRYFRLPSRCKRDNHCAGILLGSLVCHLRIGFV